MGINVLSCFDGISCGQIALERAGIQVDNYYASEIDKYAIQVTKNNYPNTTHLGSVVDVKGSDLPKIDVLIGGSPCQGFSFAGKGLNFQDPRSKLFFEFVRLLKEVKPKYFLLENVRMKKEYQDVISECLGVQPIMINSALVSAQNRVRLYWTNIGQKPYGFFNEMVTDIPPPVDKEIFLKDIFDTNVPEKFYLSDKAIKYLNRAEMNQRFIQYETDDKSNCIVANYHKGVPYNAICVASRGRNPENPTSRVAGLETEQRLEARIDGNTNSLTSVQKDNLVIYQRARGYNKGAIFKDKSPSVTSNSWEHNNTLNIRRLTPVECERLQTLPDNYTSAVSDTQRYKAIGNGWTVDVVAHIFKHINL